jgi:hypothetical protein
MTQEKVQVFMTGLAFGESPRWHDGRLWLADWAAHKLIAVDSTSKHEAVRHVPFIPFTFSLDWLPDGRLLVVSGGERPLLREEPDGSLVLHAELSNRYSHWRWWIIRSAPANLFRAGFPFIRLSREGDSSCRPRRLCLLSASLCCLLPLHVASPHFKHAHMMKCGTGGKGEESTSLAVQRRFVLPAAMAGVRCQ